MPLPFHSCRVWAPGSVGNVGPGLDILGLALTGAGDRVTAVRAGGPGIILDHPGDPALPREPDRNAAGLAAAAVLRYAGREDLGLRLSLEKGLPLAGGQGGSAASAIAAAVAVNRLLSDPLDRTTLLACGLEAEERLAGRHLDNLAPSLFGGIVLVRSTEPVEVIQLPVPSGLLLVLAHPDQAMRTSAARTVLPAAVDRATALHQAAQVGAMVAALAAGDLALLGRAIDDRIAEPVRAPLLQGFSAAKAAALAAGALGCSISGSGPTAFALAGSPAAAEAIALAMGEAYRSAGLGCRTRIARVDVEGARVESLEP